MHILEKCKKTYWWTCKSFGDYFKNQQRLDEGDSFRKGKKEEEKPKPEPVDEGTFLNAIKGGGAGTDKFMKSWCNSKQS